ncbi:MAG: DUF4143 domain-containing protein [Clostridia bacterium]
MKRKIYKDLLNWKENSINIPLMIIGARQIGKTYIIQEFCKNEFENYIYINLLDNPQIVDLFEQTIPTEEKFTKIQWILNKNIDLEKTIIFFDEIQLSEKLISNLKYFCESDKPFKIICAGSLLGVKINRFHSSFPVGKVKMEYMYPMDFEEFLMATSSQGLIDEIYKCYNEVTPMTNALHEKLLNLYRLYLCVGGMPQAVQNIVDVNQNIFNFDKTIVKNIIESYLNDMNQYIFNNTEKSRIEAIYKSIPSQLGNVSNKFQYSKINSNARSRDYETALQWLISSTMIYKCNLLKTIQIPPKAYADEEYFKLYISDVGLLTSLLEIQYNDILLDNKFLYKGNIAENYVAEQLVRNGVSLYYWKSNSDAEIDFILYNEDGLIPIEVKASDNITSKSLNSYIKKYNPKYSIRISSKNFGFENNIKSVPLYAAFLIK